MTNPGPQLPSSPHGMPGKDPHATGGHAGHNWMMIACCIPMLAIAGILVATGVAGAGALVVAVGCTLMMAMMMGGMGHGGGDDAPR